ncbi:MAG: VOC family protein [Anaerolineales bacterium]|jgi:catechol 2,3-dioxygenase-like lactoylglutathione lyase family enzyme|nr:VOC family protein [Anaerolineales bacterium]
MKPPFEQTITFLHTADLQASADFYERLLGLELVRDQGVCRIYRASPSGLIGFCQHLEPSPPQGVILTLVSADVDGWYEKLRKKGVEFTKTPGHHPQFGIYHCFFKDPNGYLLEIQRFDQPLE